MYTKDKNKVVTTLVTTGRQPKEMLTIKELSELFGISKQAMRKHVDNLETIYLAKNSHGYKTVLWSGVLQLADKLKQPELFQETTQQQKSPDIPSDLTLTTELFAQLKQKDAQIEQLQAVLAQQQKLIDQQQQLTLQANKQIEKLQEQLLLSKPEESSSEDLDLPVNLLKEPITKQKKWWHFFWKKP